MDNAHVTGIDTVVDRTIVHGPTATKRLRSTRTAGASLDRYLLI